MAKPKTYGKRLSVLDLDAVYNGISPPPVILNDLPASTESEREIVNKTIMTKYDDNDVLSSTPSCSCGQLKSGYLLGIICQSCMTPVCQPTETDIKADVWFRAPKSVKGFLNPIMWIILSQYLTTSGRNGYNLMDWLIIPTKSVPDNVSLTVRKKIQYLTDIGWKRGLNNFYDNFDDFVEILPELTTLSANTKVLQEFLKIYRDRVFTNYLPMPTKVLLVLENTPVGSYADLPMNSAVNAARSICSLSEVEDEKSGRALEVIAANVIKDLSDYIKDTLKNSFRKKRGWLRGQVFSSRSHFCGRAVITSLSEAHDYEHILIPWSLGIDLLKPQLFNLLLNQESYSGRDAIELLNGSGNVYVHTLDKLMQEIIDGYKEQGLKGYPLLFNRNPSLQRASIQNLFIPYIKSDINDKTLSLSVLDLNGPNADFDGDECNITLLPSKDLWKPALYLRPHYAIQNMISFGKLNNNSDLPDVASFIISNYLNYDENGEAYEWSQ